jgi:hypothetical protein
MNSNTIKKVHNPVVISSEQIDLLRRTICKGATEDELKINGTEIRRQKNLQGLI